MESIESVYLIPLSLGIPKTEFLAVVDTGSCDLWVPDVECRSRESAGKTRYDWQYSETSSGPIEPFDINYIGSWVKGDIFRDELRLHNLKAPGAYFGSAKLMHGQDLFDGRFDGILGLCPRGSRWGYPSLLDTLKDNDLIDRKVFSIWLYPSLEQGGILTIGRIAEEHAVSPIHWMKSIKTSKWATHLRGVYVGGRQCLKRGEASTVVLDSGCTSILVPSYFADIIHHRYMKGKWSDTKFSYQFDCSLLDKLPKIKLYFGGQNIYISPDDYTYRSGNHCYSFLDGRPKFKDSNKVWVLGQPFLRSYFTAYDLENRRFGLAIPKIPSSFPTEFSNTDTDSLFDYKNKPNMTKSK